MNYSALIVAAGKGSRSGLAINKVYTPLKDKLVLQYSIDCFLNDASCNQVVVVCNIEDFCHYLPNYQNGKIVLVKGGSTRQESVLNGMAAITSEFVYIHDGARPYISQEILNRCHQAMQTHSSALVCMPCIDTIKFGHGKIEKTLDRSLLYVAQTPQCFNTEKYYQAALWAKENLIDVTDDCSIIEQYDDSDIAIVMGSSQNIKLTWPEDFI